MGMREANGGDPAPTPLIIPHFLNPVKPPVVAIIQQRAIFLE